MEKASGERAHFWFVNESEGKNFKLMLASVVRATSLTTICLVMAIQAL
jgi:hypothetical protein